MSNGGTRYRGVGKPEELELPDEVLENDEEWEEAENEGFNANKRYTKKELEEMADALLREDANRELCRQCKETVPDSIPYGDETGNVEWQIQKDKEGVPLLDDEGNTLYVGFPELQCDKGHRWYKGEGPRRDIRGKDPILFETHLYNRKRREIYVKDGIPDPAFTMDRWGKRPTPGVYNRSHPLGRKINTEEQRKKKMEPVGIASVHFSYSLVLSLQDDQTYIRRSSRNTQAHCGGNQ